MLPIEQVAKRAKELGLKCLRFPNKLAVDGLHRQKLVIEGRRCQVIPSKIYHHPKPNIKVRPLYFPTSPWPDFFIYVSKGEESGTPSFFIVPRGAVARGTSVCADDNWIFQYMEAWSLLSESLEPEKLERRYEELNWKMQTVIGAAKNHGCEVELVEKKKFHWPRHIQNRLLINGRRCQIMSASRVSADSSIREWNIINLNPPRDKWAEYLIFIVRSEYDHKRIFIVPRDRIPKKTTTTLSTGWFLDFADKWEPLLPTEPPTEVEQHSISPERQSP